MLGPAAFFEDLPPLEIAEACQREEHHYVAVKSGLLDQVISLFACVQYAVFFDCRSEQIRTVPFPPSLALIVAESGKNRELASGDYNLRRTEIKATARAFGVRALRDLTSDQIYGRLDIPELLRWRALHIVEKNERVGAPSSYSKQRMVTVSANS